VPGADGRGGMAALVVDSSFDLEDFREQATQRLPSYARPLFLRILAALETTATFKPRKQDLIAAGFDPARVDDALYVDDPRAQAYRPLDAAVYQTLVAGTLRL
jgi:fatty-acyl-CoA synthase